MSEAIYTLLGQFRYLSYIKPLLNVRQEDVAMYRERPTTIRPYMLYDERTDAVSTHSHAPVRQLLTRSPLKYQKLVCAPTAAAVRYRKAYAQ
jgi:hypothetical protein